MQLHPLEHFEQIVLPAIQAYCAAEQSLTKAMGQDESDGFQQQAVYTVLREGGAAALYLHHFAEIIATRGAPGLEHLQGDLKSTRAELSRVCAQLGGDNEVEILGDVADALKHAVLTRRRPREVEASGQVLVVTRGFGTGRFGEGKFGGLPEVWVLARSGRRPLSAVLTAVEASWRHILMLTR